MPGNNRRNLKEETGKTSDTLPKSEELAKDTICQQESDTLTCGDTPSQGRPTHETKAAGSPINKPETDTQRNKFNGVNYLLLIAIDQYNKKAKCKPLNNPVRDAKNLEKILQERYGYEKENIISLPNKKATKRNINQNISDIIQKMTAQDQLLIYFSGHGMGGADMRLIPYDYEEGIEDYTILLNQLLNFEVLKGGVATIPNNFRSVLTIVDACYAGKSMIGKIDVRENKEVSAREIIVPCSYDQVTLDQAVNAANGELGSPFSLALCKFLKYNTADTFFPASLIPARIKADFDKIIGKDYTREVIHGLAATKENSIPKFCFSLSEQEQIPTDALAGSIVNYLNFNGERDYFDKLNIDNYNKNYFFISSVSKCLKTESIRWYVFSKQFYKITSLDIDSNLKKCHTISFKIDMQKVNNDADLIFAIDKYMAWTSSSDQKAEFRYDNITRNICARIKLADFENSSQSNTPLIIAFIVANCKSDQFHIISSFLQELIKQIETQREDNQSTPLFFNIISNYDSSISEGDEHYFDKDHMKHLYYLSEKETSFVQFKNVGKINKPNVRFWYTHTNNELKSELLSHYFNANYDDICSSNDELDIIKFIERLVSKIYKNNQKKYNEIYSTLFFNKL